MIIHTVSKMSSKWSWAQYNNTLKLSTLQFIRSHFHAIITLKDDLKVDVCFKTIASSVWFHIEMKKPGNLCNVLYLYTSPKCKIRTLEFAKTNFSDLSGRAQFVLYTENYSRKWGNKFETVPGTGWTHLSWQTKSCIVCEKCMCPENLWLGLLFSKHNIPELPTTP